MQNIAEHYENLAQELLTFVSSTVAVTFPRGVSNSARTQLSAFLPVQIDYNYQPERYDTAYNQGNKSRTIGTKSRFVHCC